MTRVEAIKIITEEGLKNYNLNKNIYNRENEVVIKCESDTWVVYATNYAVGLPVTK